MKKFKHNLIIISCSGEIYKYFPINNYGPIGRPGIIGAIGLRVLCLSTN